MKTTAPAATDLDISAANVPETVPAETEVPTASADPIVAEEVGHPIGVGVGALSAGAAGAAIGAVAGPIGIVIGAVVGAIAGGLVGEEVASAGEDATTANPDSTYTLPDLAAPTPFATGGSSLGYTPSAISGSLYSGSDAGNYLAADTTPDIPAIPAAEAELKHLEEPEQSTHVSKSASPATTVPEDHIRTTAYYHYVAREASGQPGDHLEDWIKAEREL